MIFWVCFVYFNSQRSWSFSQRTLIFLTQSAQRFFLFFLKIFLSSQRIIKDDLQCPQRFSSFLTQSFFLALFTFYLALK